MGDDFTASPDVLKKHLLEANSADKIAFNLKDFLDGNPDIEGFYYNKADGKCVYKKYSDASVTVMTKRWGQDFKAVTSEYP